MYDVCVLKHVPVSAVNNHILDNNFQTEQIHQEIKQTYKCLEKKHSKIIGPTIQVESNKIK